VSRIDQIGEVLISEEEIEKRAMELGEQITRDHEDDDVILIGILRGAVMWMTELMKHIKLDITIDFMVCSSYGSATKTSGVVKIEKDLNSDINGKSVIIVEDIVDSGVTLTYLKKYLAGRHPKSVEVCSLLDKPCGRRTEIEPEYYGFTVDDRFIVGYGLDYDQRFRQLPYISYLKQNDAHNRLPEEE
jgi:hypoxanthine phosphoribosyltransferase